MTTSATNPFYAPWDDAESALASVRDLLRLERETCAGLRLTNARIWQDGWEAALRDAAAKADEDQRMGESTVSWMGRVAAQHLGRVHRELELLHDVDLGERGATVWSVVLLVGEARLLLDQAREGWT